MRQASFLGSAHLSVVRTRCRQTERVVGSAAHVIGIVVVLTIVLPEADGTDVVAATLLQGDVTTAWALVRSTATGTHDVGEQHPPIVH